MEILEAKESNNNSNKNNNFSRRANRRLSKSPMVVRLSKSQRIDHHHQHPHQIICECEEKVEKVEAQLCSILTNHKSLSIKLEEQEIRTELTRKRRRRKQIIMEEIDMKRGKRSPRIPKMPLTWLAHLLLIVPALLIATFGGGGSTSLPVAEALNFFDQQTDSRFLANSNSNVSQQNIHSMAASGLMNVAASLVGGDNDSKHDGVGTEQMDASNSMRPSPLGKILGETTLLTTISGNGSSSSSEPARSASSIAMQLLKPRKAASQEKSSSNKHQAAALEQQIINQHSRAHHHLSGGSHQRLLPTKHRDQKVVNSILDSPTSNSNSRDSPLANLFGSFKPSAITSRSSIVKAISDNKLARSK